MLLNKLKQDNLVFRKNRDEVGTNLLTTLVSEASMIGKNNGNRDSTDEEVLRVIKKFLDNAKETRDIMMRGHVNPENINREIEILEAYLPQQMSADDIKQVVKDYFTENPNTNIGNVMKFLQMNYTGKYDGKLASQIAKEIL